MLQERPIGGTDAYLFNRKHPNRKARNLTQKRYGSILHIDISEMDDVVFIANGIYLIPKHELEKPVPTATLLREVKANSVVLSPNGKLIAYDILHGKGVYTFNIETQEILEISKFGDFLPSHRMVKNLLLLTSHSQYRRIFMSYHLMSQVM